MVNHPPHYKNNNIFCSDCRKFIECIDVTRDMNFCLGNVIKYIWRCDSKLDKLEDLKKARWYLDTYIRQQELILGKALADINPSCSELKYQNAY